MIQRIQSLFLLLIAVLSAALFFFPSFIVRTTVSASSVQEVPYLIQSNILASAAAALSGLLALVTIFLYSNRQRQMMLCRLNMLLIIGTVGLILQASDTSSLDKVTASQTSVQYSFAVYMPLVQIILDLLALRFIKKDDDLVRSADRLR